jgi:hypothetical protein
LLETGCPAVPLLGQDDVGSDPRSRRPHRPAWRISGRYDGDGRRFEFQIRPSANQVMREALKRDAAQRRAAVTRARLIEKAEASGYSSASGVNPLERAALVNRLRRE